MNAAAKANVVRNASGLSRFTALLVALGMAFVFVAAFSWASPAYADGLAVDASSPADGADLVPTSGRMWVRFDHNVASVEDNARLVHLVDGDGQEVAGERCAVSLPDPEIEFAFRQYVFLDVDGLDAGERYVIRIDAGVQAKNGSTLDEAVEIAFTIAGEGERAVSLVEPEGNAGGNGDGSGGGGGGASGGGSGGASSSEGSAPVGEGSREPDITLTHWTVALKADDSPRQTSMGTNLPHYVVLQFSKGVDYYPLDPEADLSHLDENYAKVRLQARDGTPVESAVVYSLRGNGEDREGCIYIDLEEGARLAPHADYQVVVEPGITTFSRSASSAQRYVIDFRTNGDIGGVWTVSRAVLAAMAGAALLAGVAFGVRRRIRASA